LFAAGRVAVGTTLAGSTVEEGEQDWVANADTFIVDVGPDGADDAGTFVAEDYGRIAEAGEQICLPDKILGWFVDGFWCEGPVEKGLTVWQMPEYFISIRNSSARISSRMTAWRVKGAPAVSTTNASVSMLLVADMIASDDVLDCR
jgi:hypothetical protein